MWDSLCANVCLYVYASVTVDPGSSFSITHNALHVWEWYGGLIKDSSPQHNNNPSHACTNIPHRQTLICFYAGSRWNTADHLQMLQSVVKVAINVLKWYIFHLQFKKKKQRAAWSCVELASASLACLKAGWKFFYWTIQKWQQNKMNWGAKEDRKEEEEGRWWWVNVLWSSALVCQGQMEEFDESWAVL